MTLHNSVFAAEFAPVVIREAVPADAEAAGRIMYRAFAEFHRSRGFAPDFPNVEAAVGLATAQIADPTCPSSGNLRPMGASLNGGSDPSGFEATRPARGAASGGVR